MQIVRVEREECFRQVAVYYAAPELHAVGGRIRQKIADFNGVGVKSRFMNIAAGTVANRHSITTAFDNGHEASQTRDIRHQLQISQWLLPAVGAKGPEVRVFLNVQLPFGIFWSLRRI